MVTICFGFQISILVILAPKKAKKHISRFEFWSCWQQKCYRKLFVELNEWHIQLQYDKILHLTLKVLNSDKSTLLWANPPFFICILDPNPSAVWLWSPTLMVVHSIFQFKKQFFFNSIIPTLVSGRPWKWTFLSIILTFINVSNFIRGAIKSNKLVFMEIIFWPK